MIKRHPLVLLVPFPVGAYGHQIADSEQLLWNISKLKQTSSTYFFGIFLSRPANSYHAKLIKREIFVLPKYPFLFLHRFFCRLSKEYREADFQIQDRGIELYSQLLNTPPSSMALNTSFRSEISELISYFGHLPRFALLVCRDDGYDNSFGTKIANERAYRNSDLKDFQKVVNMLSEEGYTVVRLGRHNRIRKDNLHNLTELMDIPSDIPEKMDFCIASLCDFIISTGSGPDTLGMFYRKPIYFVNAPTVGFHKSKTIKHWFLKKIVSVDEQTKNFRLLNFDEAKTYLFDEQLLRDSVLEGKISTKSRSSDEILENVRKCLSHFRGELTEPLEFIQY